MLHRLLISLVLLTTGCAASTRTPEPAREPKAESPAAKVPAGPSGPIGARVGSVDASLSLGPASGAIATFSGVNMGPGAVGKGTMELSALYRERGLLQVRTHDFNGAFDLVDIDGAKGAFARTDTEARRIRDAGLEIYLRLGNSYATSTNISTSNTELVADMMKVLDRVQKADPSKPVRYVEIWNEPDNRQFWQDSPKRFTELYIEAARAVRKAYPDIRIGGPALTPAGALTPRGNAFAEEFLREVKAAGAPLDVLTWHMYSNDPVQFADAARFYREAAEKAGFGDLEQHVTEWNTSFRAEGDTRGQGGQARNGGGGPQAGGQRTGGAPNGQRPPRPPGGRAPGANGGREGGGGDRFGGNAGEGAGDTRRMIHDREVRIGAAGAALSTAAWIAMQQGGVDQAHFYRGPDPEVYPSSFFGMFYADGSAKPAGVAALLWKAMMDHPTARSLGGAGTGPLWALAGQSADGEVALLLANSTENPLSWSLGGVTASSVRVSRLRAPAKTVEETGATELGGTLDPWEVALVLLK